MEGISLIIFFIVAGFIAGYLGMESVYLRNKDWPFAFGGVFCKIFFVAFSIIATVATVLFVNKQHAYLTYPFIIPFTALIETAFDTGIILGGIFMNAVK
ncbi:hypothetical protein [Acidithiobacillus sp.]|uniref:hypothetical protein n=1 Tax=Acidithiobacillus sp. TaxID=1872118 RepID=UPI0025C1A1EB|nr:hypothetical protein [Acidithiobacillus sp.]